ncbi:hypothetical protein PENSPDRAFT_648022 [Peniophora sp. CONT]|nr:hypothetical protein PENSPDRAFT_648022 [Peniophora sp. CONT]
MDGRHQGGFEMAPSSSQGSSRGPFIQHKRSRQHLIRQGTEPSSPITASPSMPSTPSANAHPRAERSVGSNGSISLVQSQGRDRGRDVRDALTSALSVLHAEQRRLPMDDEDALQDDYGSSTSHTRSASDKACPQPPSPTMTVFSSLDDDLLPDFLDLEADDASSRLSHIGSRPFSILPGVAESESERSSLTHGYASQPRPAPVPTPHSAPVHPPRNAVQNRNDGAYADPVIPAMQPPPGPRKAQSLQNLVGPSRLALHGRPALQHSASAQRLYEHARSSPLGGPEFSKPLPRAPAEGLQRLDEEGYASPPSQHSQAATRARRVSPLSGLPIAEPQSPSAHLGVHSYSSEQSSRSDLRPRALSSVDTQAADNAQRRLYHSASRESGFTGTEGSSRSRSSTTSSWDFVPRRTVDPAIPPELAASRIPGTSSMLSPPATRQNFSATSESSRPGVHRILQQHGIAGTRAEYSPTALSPTALSFDQSISRRGSTRSSSARSNKSSGSSQNAVDGVLSKRRDEGSGLSDLRHKISGLLRPAATPDLSPRSPEFESGPGTPRRRGKGNDNGSAPNPMSPGVGGLSMRSRGLVKQSSEQLAPLQSPRIDPNPRQSSTTARGAGTTSPQPELESFMPDELTDKPHKKKLFGGLGW